MIKNYQWHSLEIKEVLHLLKTSNEGLSNKEVEKRQKEYGLNKIEERKKLSLLALYFKQFKSPLIYILLIGGVITLFLKDFTDSIVIFGTVIINSFIGFFQERKTNEIFEQLRQFLKKTAKVKREGIIKEINAEELVPGDIIILEAGQQVPADGRLIEVNNLKINEAILTGEWSAKTGVIERLNEDTILADRDNMVYMGTLVEEGRGIAVVTNTGDKTELGKIGASLQDIKKDKTAFQKKVENFSRLLGIIILFFVFGIFVVGILTGKSFIEILTVSVATAVAAIPEGLPLVVTVIFTLGMREILKKKGLVKHLVAAEVLGSTSIICTDKTGTLTKGQMQVSGIYTATKELFGEKLKNHKFLELDGEASELMVLKMAILASDAFVENPEAPTEEWITKGRPTEQAIVKLGYELGIKQNNLIKEHPRLDELSFSSVYKYSATINKLDDKENIICYLGAPERLIENAKYLYFDGKSKIMTEKERGGLIKLIEKLMLDGLRVVGVACGRIENKIYEQDKKRNLLNLENKYFENQLKENGVFLGIIALKDPIREDVFEAIKKCQQAGMKVLIVTGDHKNTTLSVSRELGLNIKEENIMEGKELAQISEEELSEKLEKIKLYARVEPLQKLKIIEAWQEKGEIIAMTGDGVNDAPALKKANIGVALGSGTDITKEASDLVLLDNNFSIIVLAVEEGRHIIDNIRKVITYLLTGGFTEITLIGLSVIFGLPLPVLSAQILWKNFIESTPPSLALTFEPKEKEIMKRKPENPKLPLLNSEMKFIIFAVGMMTNLILFGLFYYLLKIGYPLERIRTIMFVGLAIDSFFFVFSCRNLRQNIWQYSIIENKYLFVTILAAIVACLAAVYLQIFHWLLKTVPLDLREWIILIYFGLMNLMMVEAAKYYYIQKQKTD